MHHRKATIGAITPENAHPFEWKHFQLMQNGTAQTFYNGHKLQYGKDTDTETLLHYIEDRTSILEDVPAILEQLSNRLSEDLGIIIMVCKNTKQILFYADGARESYIDIDYMHMKVKGMYNYVPWKDYGYENVGYIILDFNFNIIRDTFERLNKDQFYMYYSGNNSYARVDVIEKQIDYSSNYHWYDTREVDEWWSEMEMRKAFSTSNSSYTGGDLLSLTTEELIEHDTMLEFLSNEWANISDISMESWFRDYMTYQYWVEDMDAYKLYFEDNLRLDKVFKLAYREAFGL